MDTSLDLRELQDEVGEWSHDNFGDQPSHRPLLGIGEEVGELNHAHLKREQGIRGKQDYREAQIDAVADIVIYLCDYCRLEGIDLADAVAKTWAQVSKRNWKTFPKNGDSE